MRTVRVLGGAFGLWLCVACGDTSSQNESTKPPDSGGSDSGGSDSGGGSDTAGKSGGSSTSGSSNGSGEIGDFVSQYAKATCELLGRCTWLFGLDLASCSAAFETALTEQVLDQHNEAIAEGRIDYHPEALAACIAQVESASCDEERFEKCRPVFVGKTKLGQACTIDSECEGYGQCKVDGACPGVCAPAAKLGEPCTRYNECEPGLECEGDTGVQLCVKTAKIGESCAETSCSGYAVCSDGTCVSRASLGASDQGGPCEVLSGPSCKPGLVCTTTLVDGDVVGRCQPKVASGAACTFSTPDPCPGGEYCHITSATGVKPATGTCTVSPKLGEECRYGMYNVTSCEIGQYCDTETKVCTAKGELGAACTSSASCSSNTCVAEKCVENLECEESKSERT
jgi:hypothetical protein